MNKKLINIVITVVFSAAIIMAFVPFLKSSDDGYQGAKIIASQTEIESTIAAVVEDLQAKVIPEIATAVAAETVPENTAVQTVEKVKQVIADIVEPVTIVATAALEDDNQSALYSVVDGNKLDSESYAGFKLYRNWCARCHGTYGQGMVGPNLAESLKFISEKEFFNTVENGKAGTIGSMPSWKANVKVMEGRDQLYAYLMARSDGAIGVIKPKKQ